MPLSRNGQNESNEQGFFNKASRFAWMNFFFKNSNDNDTLRVTESRVIHGKDAKSQKPAWPFASSALLVSISRKLFLILFRSIFFRELAPRLRGGT